MFHCELAWLGGDEPAADVLIEVDGDRIAAVTAGVDYRRDTATRLRGLTLPGLANAHSHAFHRALRGRTHAGTGSFWTWRRQMYELASALDPGSYHRLARAVYAEMAMAGITCVGEFHYLHHATGGTPYDDPNEMGSVLVAAAAEAGIRITLLDTCYLHGGIGVEPDAVQQRFVDGNVDAWAERVDASLALESSAIRIGGAVHSVRAVDPASISAVAAYTTKRGMPLHAHVSEQQAENEQCVAAYGRTPTELFADGNALSGRFTAVHATHLTDGDIGLLGRAGATACLCPTTERDLADGIGPAAGLAAAGVALTIGTDSHAAIDPFEEMRAIELDERLVSHRRGNLTVNALLQAATSDGYRSLGWPEAGALRPGQLADFVSVRTDTVRMAGTDAPSALAAAVFAASAGDVDTVVVGGRVIVADGAHVAIDVVAELDAAVRACTTGAGP